MNVTGVVVAVDDPLDAALALVDADVRGVSPREGVGVGASLVDGAGAEGAGAKCAWGADVGGTEGGGGYVQNGGGCGYAAC